MPLFDQQASLNWMYIVLGLMTGLITVLIGLGAANNVIGMLLEWFSRKK